MSGKIYIAGPMSNLPEYNRPAFNAAAEKLTKDGYHVLNPATLPNGLTQSEYMDICFAMLRAADMLLLLPGWEDSAGAQAEYHYAKKLDIEIDYMRFYETEQEV